MNEDLFWRGKNMTKIADSTGKCFTNEVVTKERMVKDWHIEEGDGMWKVQTHNQGNQVTFSTVASHKMCTKKIVIVIQELIEHKVIKSVDDIEGFSFMGKVQGTKPDYEDCFKIYFDLEDSEG